jgi:hypothetical protein
MKGTGNTITIAMMMELMVMMLDIIIGYVADVGYVADIEVVVDGDT